MSRGREPGRLQRGAHRLLRAQALADAAPTCARHRSTRRQPTKLTARRRRSSSTKPAASPMEMPLRAASNGRHASRRQQLQRVEAVQGGQAQAVDAADHGRVDETAFDPALRRQRTPWRSRSRRWRWWPSGRAAPSACALKRHSASSEWLAGSRMRLASARRQAAADRRSRCCGCRTCWCRARPRCDARRGAPRRRAPPRGSRCAAGRARRAGGCGSPMPQEPSGRRTSFDPGHFADPARAGRTTRGRWACSPDLPAAIACHESTLLAPAACRVLKALDSRQHSAPIVRRRSRKRIGC